MINKNSLEAPQDIKKKCEGRKVVFRDWMEGKGGVGAQWRRVAII
jgi:hypothetical protein